MNGLAKYRRIQRPEFNPSTESFCTHCRNVKPRSAFPKNKNSGNGLHAWCLDCNNGHVREWENTPENYRRRLDQKAMSARRSYAATHGKSPHEGPIKARYYVPPRMRETATT